MVASSNYWINKTQNMQLAPNYYHSPSVARASMPLAFDEVDSHAPIHLQNVSANRSNMHHVGLFDILTHGCHERRMHDYGQDQQGLEVQSPAQLDTELLNNYASTFSSPAFPHEVVRTWLMLYTCESNILHRSCMVRLLRA